MRHVTLAEIVEIADRLFPFSECENWDNCGIQIGDPSETIDGVAFSLDPLPETLAFAVENACGLLITHHPAILEPIRRITPESLVGRTLLHAARSNIGILSLHTNLDCAEGGLNHWLAGVLGLEKVRIPVPARAARLGVLPDSFRISQVADLLAEKLHVRSLRIIAREDRLVKTIFCVSGSGMGYLKDALAWKADLMITGDVRYHAAREALELGLPVIDAGHFGLEKDAVSIMCSAFDREFTQMGLAVRCVACPIETDPFQTYTTPGGFHLERTTSAS